MTRLKPPDDASPTFFSCFLKDSLFLKLFIVPLIAPLVSLCYNSVCG